MKEFLSQRDVPYTEKNIRADRAALAELLDLGFRATPVTVIDGEAFAGFDPEKFEQMLAG